MIKINLLGDDTAVDQSGALQVGAFAVSIVVLLGICFMLNQSAGTHVAELEDRKLTLEGELERLKKTTKEVRELEKKRADLKNRLAVIAMLKRSKTGPVRVLDDLNLALPERSWVVSLSEKTGNMNVNGFALDNQTIAELMKSLEKSEFFRKVSLGQTKQATKKGVKVKEFTLKTTISYSGSLRLDPGRKENSGKKS